MSTVSLRVVKLVFLNVDIYHLLMCYGSISVHASVSLQNLTFEKVDLETSFLVRRYIFRWITDLSTISEDASFFCVMLDSERVLFVKCPCSPRIL